jgi:hypothetical protein
LFTDFREYVIKVHSNVINCQYCYGFVKKISAMSHQFENLNLFNIV